MASGIDTVIFDMDGVIFDSEILVLQAWKEVAERHGIAGVEAACHECLGTNSVVSKGVFLKHYGEDFPYEEYKAEMAEVFFSHASGGKLAKKPGVEELLKYLKMRGFKIGLASSTREVLVRSEISDGGLLGYFDQIVGGDMVERSKPEPDIFLEACRRLGNQGGLCSRDASDHGAGSDGGDGGDEVPRRRDSGIALRSAGIFAGVRHINSFVFMSVSD